MNLDDRNCILFISGEKSKTIVGQSQLQPAEGQPLPATVDELSLVGYSEETDVSQVFEKTGNPVLFE